MQDWFNVAYKFVRSVEGGYSNRPNDRGGETNYGIATKGGLAEAKRRGIIPNNYTVKDLTEQDVKRIYREIYWDGIKGDKIAQIDPKLAIALFDFYINAGGNAVKELQKIIGAKPDGVVGNETLAKLREYVDQYGSEKLINEFLKARENYYREIANKKPDQREFLSGWLNRIERLKRFLDTLNISKDLSDYYYNNACWMIPYYLNPKFEKVKSNVFEGIRRIDPLVIDLNGDGIKLIDIKESRAMFDLSGSGFANRVGWVKVDYNVCKRD